MAESSPLVDQGRSVPLARVLTEAVNGSGRARRDIARASGLHKDAFLRALRGTRGVTPEEAMLILDATGVPSKAILVLALTGSEELALRWMHHDVGIFFDELISRLPEALSLALGDNLSEIKPRWAGGTAKLVARLLADHVAEASSRDAEISELRRSH